MFRHMLTSYQHRKVATQRSKHTETVKQYAMSRKKRGATRFRSVTTMLHHHASHTLAYTQMRTHSHVSL